MKILRLWMAAVVAVGMLSTSALGLTVFGNVSEKGSLLIYPRIQVGPGFDTLITLTNDSSAAVRLKCYYATSDLLATPYTGTAAGARGLKHFEDFTIDLTHNQPIAWWASDGRAYRNSQIFGGFAAPPFGHPFPDGNTRDAGELKCWAITDDGSGLRTHNHLFGTASIFILPTGQADEYTAWAFQSISPTGGGPAPGSINGSVTVTDTINPGFVPCSPISIVGDCTSIHHIGLGNTGGGTGAYAGSNGPTNAPLLDWVFATPGALLNEIRIPGFAFDILTAVVNPKAPLTCNPTSCADTLTVTISGIVTGAGFNPTPFNGTLAMTGSCTGNGTACTGNYSAGYTYSMASSGAAAPCGLTLDNVCYDACPNILLGNFLASGIAGNATRVTLASCNEDLRQAFTPTITKLTWTVFNQDEAARTGTHFCADSWFETTFPVASWPFTTITGLGTEVGYFRIETTADKQVCGPDAVTSAYVGVIEQANALGNLRGTNLTGRGPATGVILFDPFRP